MTTRTDKRGRVWEWRPRARFFAHENLIVEQCDSNWYWYEFDVGGQCYGDASLPFPTAAAAMDAAGGMG